MYAVCVVIIDSRVYTLENSWFHIVVLGSTCYCLVPSVSAYCYLLLLCGTGSHFNSIHLILIVVPKKMSFFTKNVVLNSLIISVIIIYIHPFSITWAGHHCVLGYSIGM